MALNSIQEQWLESNDVDYSDLKLLFINTTLKASPSLSHTEGLFNTVMKPQLEKLGVSVEVIRAVDHTLPFGVRPDMTEHGAEKDDWPALYKKVMHSDILIIGSPIWLGEESSVCRVIIERLYGNSAIKNEKGQYAYYGKVGGALITGNEDGVKHTAMTLLYSLQHLGFTIPPQADAGWIGTIGPGPSYCDEGSGGSDNDFTNRNTTFMMWNLLHMAHLLKDNGLRAHGNQRDQWDAGCSPHFDNPEYR